MNQVKQSSEKQGKLKIKIYDNFEEMQYLKERWNDLLVQSTFPNIFLTWEWITTWWKWFGQNGKLRLLEVFEGERMVAIIPLYEGSISVLPGIKMSALRFIGDGGPVYPDYLGPIISADDVPLMDSIAGLLVTIIGEKVSVIWLSSMLLDSSPNQSLVDQYKKKFTTEITDEEVCPSISLPKDYETFLSKLHRRRRESVRRQLRKAKKKFNIRIERCDTSKSVNTVFDQLRAIYKKSFRGQEDLNSCFNRDDYFEFHQEIAKSFADKKWLRLYLLWFDDTPVAFVYGYMFNNIYWYYQTSYDQAYRKSGAGSVAIQLVIKAVIEEGAKEFDFLRGDEEYKFHFANNQRQQSSVKVFLKNNPAVLGYRLKHAIIQKFNGR